MSETKAFGLHLLSASLLLVMTALVFMQARYAGFTEPTSATLCWQLAYPKLALILMLVTTFRLGRSARTGNRGVARVFQILLVVACFISVAVILQYLSLLATPVHTSIH